MSDDAFAPTVSATSTAQQTLAVRFTGSGSEYFRIWIVNLLLTLVTLSLYLPFARARRMTYFHNNTVVGGDALGFHADPWKMFRGYMLILCSGIAYSVASKYSPVTALILLLVMAGFWPALWRASMQFRLRNTSWRGVRFGFLGDLRSAYVCVLPMIVPFILLTAAGLLLQSNQGAGEQEALQTASKAYLGFMGVIALASTVMLPWLFVRLKRYQHGGFQFAGQQAQLNIDGVSMYRLSLKTTAYFLAVGVVTAIVIAISAAVVGVTAAAKFGTPPSLVVIAGLVGALMYLIPPLTVSPYVVSRLQNLLWGNTQSQGIQFRSNLAFGAYTKLNAKNILLMILTLGLYWPFAKVRSVRAKLEAMQIEVNGDIGSWIAEKQASANTLGDAAGDFFGIDLGL